MKHLKESSFWNGILKGRYSFGCCEKKLIWFLGYNDQIDDCQLTARGSIVSCVAEYGAGTKRP